MIKNFKNLRVTIMGLGLHGGGIGAVEFLAGEGAKVLVTDLKAPDRLASSLRRLAKYRDIKFILGQHRSEDFTKADLIIKNPAVNPQSRYLELARKNKIPIETDMGIFIELCPCPIIGVTGSKGKSTTAALVYKLFSSKIDKICLAGNIRVSVLSKLKELTKKSLCILELSSWQLDDMILHKRSPCVAIVLNLIPDHLNRYQNFQAYVEAKKHIFYYQTKKDILILNFDDPIVKSFSEEAKSQVIFFGKNLTGKIPQNQIGAYLKDNELYFRNETEPIMKLEEIVLKGEHNIYNILAALTLAKIYHLSDNLINRSLKNFVPLEGRIEFIKEAEGIKFYNDTSATIPDAVMAAIKSFPDTKNIVLISGGEDKELDYSDLAKTIVKRVKKLILLKGSASDKIIRELKELLGSDAKYVKLVAGDNLTDMKEVVKLAMDFCAKGDIILLSPGAASFNLFDNEFDRGDQFKRAVKEIVIRT